MNLYLETTHVRADFWFRNLFSRLEIFLSKFQNQFKHYSPFKSKFGKCSAAQKHFIDVEDKAKLEFNDLNVYNHIKVEKNTRRIFMRANS